MARAVTEYQAGPFQALANMKLGKALWTFLNEEETVTRMDTATDLGNPAVAGIEQPLLERFEGEVVGDRVKQMIGHMVRQVMEAEGYEIEKQNVTISSALFLKGTRYRRPEWQRLQVFRNSKNARELCFAGSRDVDSLPPPAGGGKWRFWASFATILRGHIVYGIDVREVRKEVADKGFALRPLKRMLRAG